jgi:Transposase DDE domain group 1
VFSGDELRVADLRPSTSDASRHSRAIRKLLVQRLRAVWPAVRITVRADSGLGRWRLMRWWDSHGIGSVLGLARNAVLERQGRLWIDAARRLWERRGLPPRIVGTFS